MQLIRSITALLITPPLTLLVSLLALADLTLGRKSPSRAMVFPRIWGRIICRLIGARVRVEGLEKLEKGKTYIFAGNHASQVDIFAFQGYFPYDFRWIAKKELFAIPVFGPAMRLAGFIPIDRSRGRQAMQSLIEAAEKIRSGTSVIIFPEGTRSRDGRLRQFKTGAVLLAIKAGVDIVPLGFIGTHDVLPKGHLLARSGNVTIRIGAPVSTRDYTPRQKKELAALLHDRVAALLDGDTTGETASAQPDAAA